MTAFHEQPAPRAVPAGAAKYPGEWGPTAGALFFAAIGAFSAWYSVDHGYYEDVRVGSQLAAAAAFFVALLIPVPRAVRRARRARLLRQGRVLVAKVVDRTQVNLQSLKGEHIVSWHRVDLQFEDKEASFTLMPKQPPAEVVVYVDGAWLAVWEEDFSMAGKGKRLVETKKWTKR